MNQTEQSNNDISDLIFDSLNYYRDKFYKNPTVLMLNSTVARILAEEAVGTGYIGLTREESIQDFMKKCEASRGRVYGLRVELKEDLPDNVFYLSIVNEI